MIKIKNIISNVANYVRIIKRIDQKDLLALKEELKENIIKHGLTMSLDYCNVKDDNIYSSAIYAQTYRWIDINQKGLRVFIFSTWKEDEYPFFIDIELSQEEKREIFKKSEIYDDYFNIMDQEQKKVYFSRYWKVD